MGKVELELRVEGLDEIRSQLTVINEMLMTLVAASATVPVKVKPATRKAAATAKDNGVDPDEVKDEIDDDDQDSEEDLRAQAELEGKRISRTLGVGALRVAIKKVTGRNILRIDDVPAKQLPTLIYELQAR